MQLLEELDEALGVVGVLLALEDEAASVPSGRKARAADIESRVQAKWWRRTGVCPLGAQVALTGGRREKPLSSWKTTHAFLRRALFLCEASR